MSNYKVVEVNNKKELKMFVKFPNILYKDCEQWVPALYGDQVKSLTKTPSLKDCEQKMWMVMRGSEVVGRICGIINNKYNKIYNTKRARFGWFDTIEDIEVARLLIDTAESWAKNYGMTEIHGPLYYNTLGKQGMLVDGFENTPPFNCIYNFEYYPKFVEELGFAKECDWIQYKVRADQGLPEKLERVAHRLMERYNLVEADIEELKKDEKLVNNFFHSFNKSFDGIVYNFIPYSDEEIEEERDQILPFVDNKYCTLLMDENRDFAAYGVAIPSISEGLKKAKGSLFPFGWWHLLRALKKNDTVDLMLAGATPEWQNTGVSSLFHYSMSKKFIKAGVKWAITNPQFEDNLAVNVWGRYENEPFMRRRCYIKEIK